MVNPESPLSSWILKVLAVVLPLGAGVLVSLSVTNGWPLFVVIPAYGLAGALLIGLFIRRPGTKAGTAVVLGMFALGAVLYLVH